MEIRVKVIPNKKKETILTLPDGRFEVSVKEDRKDGMANERMLKLLSEYFSVSRKDIHLKSGHTSSTKTLIVNN